MVVDARPFADPDGRRGCKHIGFDTNLVVGVVESRHFRTILGDLASDLEIAAQCLRGAGRILVVVYCRKGVHRSVAFGHVIRCLLADNPRVEMLPSHHASQRIWRTDYCGECVSCRRATTPRSDAICRALRVWRTLSPFEVFG